MMPTWKDRLWCWLFGHRPMRHYHPKTGEYSATIRIRLMSSRTQCEYDICSRCKAIVLSAHDLFEPSADEIAELRWSR